MTFVEGFENRRRTANCELRMGIRALLISIERGDSPSRRRLDSMPKRG
ncbi:hypothetical protein BURPS305_7200 [Burkholderia pseudomallei 305]|nr:hypothetical protein BURPS305_7200 [Burkholderia pseudomallei 305]